LSALFNKYYRNVPVSATFLRVISAQARPLRRIDRDTRDGRPAAC
jgi:hypothetical protein